MSQKHSENVKVHFSNEWREYDAKIKKVIPFYNICFNVIIDILKQAYYKPKSILDIGIGTGNLSLKLLEAFPKSELTGIDLVDDFINIARQKLINYSKNVKLICKDIKEFSFINKYDLIVTSFMFHHLENKEKKLIYKKIYGSLNQNGFFFNLDFVGSSSRYFYNLFDKIRIMLMQNEGIDKKTIQKDYIEHRALEIPVPDREQMIWLEKIGFQDIECFWKYINLSVFGGRKI
jgi:tRNA (cmo5U34)-methyltransferase